MRPPQTLDELHRRIVSSAAELFGATTWAGALVVDATLREADETVDAGFAGDADGAVRLAAGEALRLEAYVRGALPPSRLTDVKRDLATLVLNAIRALGPEDAEEAAAARRHDPHTRCLLEGVTELEMIRHLDRILWCAGVRDSAVLALRAPAQRHPGQVAMARELAEGLALLAGCSLDDILHVLVRHGGGRAGLHAVMELVAAAALADEEPAAREAVVAQLVAVAARAMSHHDLWRQPMTPRDVVGRRHGRAALEQVCACIDAARRSGDEVEGALAAGATA